MRMLILVACVVVPTLAAQGRASPAPPLGAWTPVPELPGMGRPVDTASVAARPPHGLARSGALGPPGPRARPPLRAPRPGDPRRAAASRPRLRRARRAQPASRRGLAAAGEGRR